MSDDLETQIQALLREQKLGCIWLPQFSSSKNSFFSYASGIPPEATSAGHALFVRDQKKPLIFLGPLEKKNLFLGHRGQIRLLPPRPKFISIIRKLAHKRIGTVYNAWPHDSMLAWKKNLPRIRFCDISGELSNLRSTKNPIEIRRIQKAVQITARVIDQIPDWDVERLTEHQLANRIDSELLDQGQSPLAFPTIVANRGHSGVPHHVPSASRIRNGWLLIDCGARFQNYCADMSRTLYVGSPGPRQRRLYESVFQVQQESLDEIRIGRPYGDVFDWARKRLFVLTGHKLIHGLGHGLGIDVHDYPRGFLKGNNGKIASNHVLTVEPGIYGKWGGIRIEDDGVMTPQKFKFFSKAPNSLVKI